MTMDELPSTSTNTDSSSPESSKESFDSDESSNIVGTKGLRKKTMLPKKLRDKSER